MVVMLMLVSVLVAGSDVGGGVGVGVGGVGRCGDGNRSGVPLWLGVRRHLCSNEVNFIHVGFARFPQISHKRKFLRIWWRPVPEIFSLFRLAVSMSGRLEEQSQNVLLIWCLRLCLVR